MNPKVANIIRECAAKYNVTPRQILGKTQTFPVTIARHEAFYRVRNELSIGGRPYSYPMIGKLFNKKDHSTVIYGIKRHVRRVIDGVPDRRVRPRKTCKPRDVFAELDRSLSHVEAEPQ